MHLFPTFPIFLNQERKWFVNCLRRIVLGGISAKVYFSDVILADILTSFSKVFGDLQLVIVDLVTVDANYPLKSKDLLREMSGHKIFFSHHSIPFHWTDVIAPILIRYE